MTVTVNVNVSAADAQQIGQQVARAVRRRREPPALPRVPWQHHQLFREPVFAAGLVLVDVDDGDEGD